MDFENACKWLNAADVLESQETLTSFKSADWPHLKKRYREKTHKELHKRAFPFEWNNAAPLKLEDAAIKLSGLAIPSGKRKGK